MTVKSLPAGASVSVVNFAVADEAKTCPKTPHGDGGPAASLSLDKMATRRRRYHVRSGGRPEPGSR